MAQMNLSTKNRLPDIENRFVIAKGGGGEGQMGSLGLADAHNYLYSSVQFSSVAQSCPTLCDPMNHSTPGLPVYHQFPEFTQTHVH